MNIIQKQNRKDIHTYFKYIDRYNCLLMREINIKKKKQNMNINESIQSGEYRFYIRLSPYYI